jgi:hypothetical protein
MMKKLAGDIVHRVFNGLSNPDESLSVFYDPDVKSIGTFFWCPFET